MDSMAVVEYLSALDHMVMIVLCNLHQNGYWLLF